MNSTHPSEFGPEVLLVFVGHSSDADKEAQVILDLERDLLRELEHLQVAANGTLPFKTVRCWEWRNDAAPKVGGQDATITPELVRANIALFVFKERVGTVTWSELEWSRKRASPPILVLAFFPANSPESRRMSDVAVAEAWADLLRKKRALVADWTAPDSKSLRPTTDYKDVKHLKEVVLEHMKNAFISVLSSLPPAVVPGSGHTPEPISTLHQLPSAPWAFTGREEDLNYLETTLTAQGNIGAAISASGAGIQGMPGVGKTALATVLAHRFKEEYPDAQICLNLRAFDPTGRKPMSPAEAMQTVIRVFHPRDKSPETAEDLAPKYNSVLNEAGRVLLFLDNAANAEQIQPLLPPPKCLLLVTSRNQFSLPGLVTRNIDCLPPEKSRELLLKLAPRTKGQETIASELCGHLPLALEVFAGIVWAKPLHSVEELVDRLRKKDQKLGKVEAAFQLSYDLLEEPLRRCWTLLAIFPANFDLPAAAAIWEMETNASRDTMEALLKGNLVETDEVKIRLRLHDLVRQFCNGKLSEAERDAAMTRYVRHYTEVGTEANQLFLKGGDTVLRGLELFDRERIQMEAAYEWLAPKRDEASAALLISLVDAVVYADQALRFHPCQRIRWLESQREAARITKNRKAEAAALTHLGHGYADLGERRKAIEFHEEVLVITREIGDRRGEGISLGNLGSAYFESDEPRKAIERYEKSLVIAREIGDRRGEGNALGGLGCAYDALGKGHKAIELCEQALVIDREIGDLSGEAYALSGRLGTPYSNWATRTRQSSFTGRHWLLPTRLATCAAKAIIFSI